ncbi:hypothetical protein [Enterovibrio norvegicus]|uniref:hypothetical protein n=1 Tax=Enterovibrio norvegicus TaxID=188144 RepID=UPI00352C7827
MPELRWVCESAVNTKNTEKVASIQAKIEKSLKSKAFTPLVVTFAIKGKPGLSAIERGLSKLNYNAAETYVVGNALTLVAVCKILALKTFMLSSRLSVKEARRKSELRQRLAMEDVEVRIVFDDDVGLTSEQITDLFLQNSLFDSSLHLTHAKEGVSIFPQDVFPLKPFIEKLREETNLNSYGGVSVESKHVKVSDSYVTTQYVLFKTIVGAVAGISSQTHSKMSKDVRLADGRSISSILADGYTDNISAFLIAWLKPLKLSFKNDRSGFHLSPLVWQSLGLVIHNLVKDGASYEALKNAGRRLGELDYQRKAPHWEKCAVMELDSKGRIYKNAANSTREFRIGLANYFLQVVRCKLD